MKVAPHDWLLKHAEKQVEEQTKTNSPHLSASVRWLNTVKRTHMHKRICLTSKPEELMEWEA